MLTKEQRKLRREARRARIKAFFKKVADWFKNIEQKLEEKLPDIIDASLKVMNWIKKVADSQVVDMITDLTDTTVDDVFKDRVRKAIDVSIDKLTDGKECALLPTWEEKILCFANTIKSLSASQRAAQLQAFHASIIAELHGNEEDNSVYNYLAAQSYLGQKLSTENV